MIRATWIKDDNNLYRTEIRNNSGKSIEICSSRVASGSLSPRELVQGALAGCLSMTIRRELCEAGIDFEDVTVNVDMGEENGRITFNYQIVIDSEGDSEKIEEIKKQAVNDCYIRGMLSDGIDIKEYVSGVGNAVCDCCCG